MDEGSAGDMVLTIFETGKKSSRDPPPPPDADVSIFFFTFSFLPAGYLLFAVCHLQTSVFNDSRFVKSMQTDQETNRPQVCRNERGVRVSDDVLFCFLR